MWTPARDQLIAYLATLGALNNHRLISEFGLGTMYEEDRCDRRRLRAANSSSTCLGGAAGGRLGVSLRLRESRQRHSEKGSLRPHAELRLLHARASAGCKSYPRPEQRRRRPPPVSSLQHLGPHEIAVPTSIEQSVLSLRRSRHFRLRGMGGRLSGVREMGAIQWVCRRLDHRPHRQRRQLRAGQLPMGYTTAAICQPGQVCEEARR